jgi:glucokinase
MTPWRIGVDVGGTKIAAGLVDIHGQVRDRLALPTPATEGPDAILGAIADTVATLRGKLADADRVLGVGIGTGGVVDHRDGVIVSATGLLQDWTGTRVAEQIRDRSGLPVAVDNDGNALALGEHRFGVGRELTDVIYVAVGTGVGGGIVLGDQLRRGVHHTAGELGHLCAPGSVHRRCSCGGYGHLEAVAAGPAITADYRHRSGDGQASDLRVVAQRAESGDPHAADAIGHGGAVLGAVLAGLADTLDPQAIVIGGGVAQLGAVYWTPLQASFAAEALPAVKPTPLLPASLGSAAAVIGAAALIPATDLTDTDHQ